MHDMCGRVIQASPPDQLGLKIIDALDPRDKRVTGDPFGNVPPRYNGAPSQQLWVIRQNPQTGARSLDLKIEKAWMPAVRANLAVTLRLARQVAGFALPDDAEPAPVFKA